MSIRLMTLVWDIEFPTQSQKLIMLKLADYASDTGGSVFPAMETLAEKAGCDERTAQRALKAFRECGLIHLVRAGGTGPKATNEWKLNVQLIGWLADGCVALVGAGGVLEIDGTMPEDMGDKLPGSKGDIKGGNLSARVTNDALRVANCTSKGDTTATQSVNNHQLDSSRAGACASEGSRAASAAKAQPLHRIAAGEIGWAAWQEWLTDNGHRELAVAASECGWIEVVGSKYPKDGCQLPRVDRSSAIAKRAVGEGV